MSYEKIKKEYEKELTLGQQCWWASNFWRGHDGCPPGMEIYECQSLSRVVSTSKLAPDWLHESEQPIRSQVSNLTQLLTMTTTRKFPLQYASSGERRVCKMQRFFPTPNVVSFYVTVFHKLICSCLAWRSKKSGEKGLFM